MDKIDFLNYKRLEEWLESQIEKERQRINQDAHDKVYNRLAALAHITESAINGNKVPKETLKHLHESLREINSELHKIISAKPASSEHKVNEKMLNQLLKICRNHAAVYNQELHLTCWPTEQLQINPDDFWHFECILQECLNNIGKHSEADFVEMSVEADDKYYILKVKDNGTGIRNTDINQGKGLKGMHERARSLGGRLNINSGNNGTSITLKIPQKST